MKRVAVVILSPSDQSLERFVFDMSSFPSVPPNKHHTPLLQPEDDVHLSGEALANLEAQFRACLMKLNVCSEPLGKLPENCTFGLAIELNDEQATLNNVKPTLSYLNVIPPLTFEPSILIPGYLAKSSHYPNTQTWPSLPHAIA